MRGKRIDHPVYPSVTLSLTLSPQGRGESEEEHYPVSKFEPNTIGLRPFGVREPCDRAGENLFPAATLPNPPAL
jgi:hypothetical protein